MKTLGFTCLKDDGPYLVEWLAHHLAAGFGKMLVLTHDCTDGSDALMDALTADPRIAHVPFDRTLGKAVQWQALAHAARHAEYQSADWALFFDVDEFLCLDGSADIAALIEAFGGDAIALPWRLFGSGGQETWRDGLTPERFLRGAAEDLHFPLAHLFKTLHRPAAFQKPGVHRPRGRKGEATVWTGPDGAPLPRGFDTAQNAISLYGLVRGKRQAWLNHYSLRSRDEFMVKRSRGLPNHEAREIGVTYWLERNWNMLEERSIAGMLPATRATYDALMALPGVAEAHRACRAAHDARARALASDVEAARLAFRLKLAGDSTPPTAADARQLMKQVAAARASAAD